MNTSQKLFFQTIIILVGIGALWEILELVFAAGLGGSCPSSIACLFLPLKGLVTFLDIGK